jgi:phospholipase/carboxylesterase
MTRPAVTMRCIVHDEPSPQLPGDTLPPVALQYRERPARGDPTGLLFLHHGRGTDERDLLPLADQLDPDGSLHVLAPRAPLQLGGAGYHWYVVPRVGYPDPETFHNSYRRLAELHDETWQRLGLASEQTILGGFSMGSVMSYALGLGPDRPATAGILAFSGFVPVVEGWQPQLPRPTRVFIAHGRLDPVMEIGFAQRARQLLEESGMDVEYHESDHGHWIEPEQLTVAKGWLARLLSPTY